MMAAEQLDPNLRAWLGDRDRTPEPDPLTHALDALFQAGPDRETTTRAVARAHQALAAAAKPALYYTEIPDTPLGRLFIAVSDEGVVALNFSTSRQVFLEEVRKRSGVEPTPSPERTAEAARQVREYLSGRRTRFELSLDLRNLTDFQRQVLVATAQVPRGQVVTYAEIARRIGKPRAFRAVGQALGHNPVPIIIPCHRVVGSDGALRGYSGGRGVATKAQLLRLEGAYPALA